MGRLASFPTIYIDPGLLCIVLGQTPGGGVAEALSAVIAHDHPQPLAQGRSFGGNDGGREHPAVMTGSQFSSNALVAAQHGGRALYLCQRGVPAAVHAQRGPP